MSSNKSTEENKDDNFAIKITKSHVLNFLAIAVVAIPVLVRFDLYLKQKIITKTEEENESYWSSF